MWAADANIYVFSLAISYQLVAPEQRSSPQPASHETPSGSLDGRLCQACLSQKRQHTPAEKGKILNEVRKSDSRLSSL
jgi:hypothetical protein